MVGAMRRDHQQKAKRTVLTLGYSVASIRFDWLILWLRPPQRQDIRQADRRVAPVVLVADLDPVIVDRPPCAHGGRDQITRRVGGFRPGIVESLELLPLRVFYQRVAASDVEEIAGHALAISLDAMRLPLENVHLRSDGSFPIRHHLLSHETVRS